MNNKFIGYGSLINHQSLKETIKDKKFTPVIVKGYKRIFNLEIREKGKTDILNLEKNKSSKFNGIMFEVSEEELIKLKRREEEYNIEEIEAYEFNSNKKLGKALIAVDYFIGIDHDHKKPNEHYFKLCREGAYKIGKKFGKMWDETTYTSDNLKISDWVKITQKSF